MFHVFRERRAKGCRGPGPEAPVFFEDVVLLVAVTVVPLNHG